MAMAYLCLPVAYSVAYTMVDPVVFPVAYFICKGIKERMQMSFGAIRGLICQRLAEMSHKGIDSRPMLTQSSHMLCWQVNAIKRK